METFLRCYNKQFERYNREKLLVDYRLGRIKFKVDKPLCKSLPTFGFGHFVKTSFQS